MPRQILGVCCVIACLAITAAVAQARNLHQGNSGADVTQAQKALGDSADGSFGPATYLSVIAYQQLHGLLIDGIVGSQTKRSLFGWDRSNQSTKAPPPPSQPQPNTGSTAATSSAPRAQSTSPSSGSQSRASSASTGSKSFGASVPASIVQCESQGNYSAVNRSTGAGGAYQIMPSTWRAYGGSGLAQNASKVQQDAVAARIWAAKGPSAWSCR